LLISPSRALKYRQLKKLVGETRSSGKKWKNKLKYTEIEVST
jgi:hypothetical protein